MGDLVAVTSSRIPVNRRGRWQHTARLTRQEHEAEPELCYFKFL